MLSKHVKVWGHTRNRVLLNFHMEQYMQNFAFGFANVVINNLYIGDILDNFKNSCFFKWFSIRLNL